MENKFPQDLRLASIRLIRKCPVCQTQYRPRNSNIIENTKSEALIYINCFNCKSSLIVSLIEMPFGLLGSGLLTDLALEEVKHFLKSEKVSMDDVLKVYELLHRQ